MQDVCMDSYNESFGDYGAMLRHQKEENTRSEWLRSRIKDIQVLSLDASSPLADGSGFADGVSREAVDDTVKNLGLALVVDGKCYPVRDTAYKSLLDRAKISGSALPKLKREDLAVTLNACLKLYDSQALLLMRDEKVSAVHGGDSSDYSVLPVDELLETLKEELDSRFPGSVFEAGYVDHALVSASWRLPGQKKELLKTYLEVLEENGQKKMADQLMPGIRFMTSDVGAASAKVSAVLFGAQHAIHIGSCLSVDHRRGKSVTDFRESLGQLFAQFGDTIAKLEKLADIWLDHPVPAMARICRKLGMPKKAYLEAVDMFRMATGEGIATAHDVFMAMQEIPFLLKASKAPQAKILSVEESMARALSLKWADYDMPAVEGGE